MSSDLESLSSCDQLADPGVASYQILSESARNSCPSSMLVEKALPATPLPPSLNPQRLAHPFLNDAALSPTFKQLAGSAFNNFSSSTDSHSLGPLLTNSIHESTDSSVGRSTSEVFTPPTFKVESDTSSQNPEFIFHELENSPTETKEADEAPVTNSFSTPPASSRQFPLSAGQNVPSYAAVESQFAARSSIPTSISTTTYAHQCITAAHASRLNPYALHHEEQDFLEEHLGHLQVTLYLNIRNGILRLWTRNPLISVTLEEAIGCVKDARWTSLASFAYEWLVRRGYINFGCVEAAAPSLTSFRRGRKKEVGPTIVVVGAGMAGLGCARQLENLFQHYERTIQPPPRVVVLEGRQRIGGRIHSYPVSTGDECEQFLYDVMPTAEMGAHIIVGFDHGNPLDAIIRGQLALPHHTLRDLSTIYDINGKPVDPRQDRKTQALYNEILERSCKYRHKFERRAPAEGDREMIESGKDDLTEDGVTIKQHAEGVRAEVVGEGKTKKSRKGFSHKPVGRLSLGDEDAPKQHAVAEGPAAEAAQTSGWTLKDGVDIARDLDLDALAHEKHQNLGKVMDESLRQFGDLTELTPQDLRLINWHVANLEYANNSNINSLSLTGWDQDIGNEFSGEHSQVIGGYQQLPRALWRAPEKLDIRVGAAVRQISYTTEGLPNKQTVVICENGEIIYADKVVFTAPLGVLKDEAIEFNPPLPDWKLGAIRRLGFGVLNKIVLVFETPFWDIDRDILGLLREPDVEDSMDQKDYERGRGKFFLFWNCVRTCGIPMLIGLISGDAAQEAELTTDEELVSDVIARLRNVYGAEKVPEPLETIVTRWRKDRFARGSYSYVGAEALPGDYDLMAKPVGNLFFAGEATCGTHPATVHGAYLSGLRAASEVLDSLIGPIQVKTPLVPARSALSSHQTTPVVHSPLKRKRPEEEPQPPTPTPTLRLSRAEALKQHDNAMWDYILSIIGERPVKLVKTGLNPFLLFSKDNWAVCKTRYEAEHAASVAASTAAGGRPRPPPSKTEIRNAVGLMWREASEDVRQPYFEAIAKKRADIEADDIRVDKEYAEWVRRSYEVKDEWIAQGNAFEDWARKTGLHVDGVALATDAANSQPTNTPSTSVPASAPEQIDAPAAPTGDGRLPDIFRAASEFGIRQRKAS